jgi:2-polyprenyl-3-methyl-5-hydroxy-6-metoxy-1,4-benzoquinol methylase
MLLTKEKNKLPSLKPVRIYSNQGNEPLIDMLNTNCKSILDVGCGAGDNAALIKSRHTDCKIYGVTYSYNESELAKNQMEKCWVFDIERELPTDLEEQKFDCLIFSHVLEHVRDPGIVLARFTRLLCRGGQVLIAVPNILSWRMRLQFLKGNFEYQSSGELDDTHLRFFTYYTASQYLLSNIPELYILSQSVSGSVPLWFLRNQILPQTWCIKLDRWGCKHWPNLFGSQVLIQVTKQ